MVGGRMATYNIVFMLMERRVCRAVDSQQER